MRLTRLRRPPAGAALPVAPALRSRPLFSRYQTRPFLAAAPILSRRPLPNLGCLNQSSTPGTKPPADTIAALRARPRRTLSTVRHQCIMNSRNNLASRRPASAGCRAPSRDPLSSRRTAPLFFRASLGCPDCNLRPKPTPSGAPPIKPNHGPRRLQPARARALAPADLEQHRGPLPAPRPTPFYGPRESCPFPPTSKHAAPTLAPGSSLPRAPGFSLYFPRDPPLWLAPARPSTAWPPLLPLPPRCRPRARLGQSWSPRPCAGASRGQAPAGGASRRHGT